MFCAVLSATLQNRRRKAKAKCKWVITYLPTYFCFLVFGQFEYDKGRGVSSQTTKHMDYFWSWSWELVMAPPQT